MKTRRVVDSKVLDFLAASGGAPLDELIARVPARPHKLVAALQKMQANGLLKIAGPKTLDDLDRLISNARLTNGYDQGTKDYQRRAILRSIFHEEELIAQTKVRLSVPGYALALD